MKLASAVCSFVSVVASLATFVKERTDWPHGHAKTKGLICGPSRERLRNCASCWCEFLCPAIQPWTKTRASGWP